jgi:Flp pilus assembly protein, pilin Flp
MLRSFFAKEEGQGLVEYALILVLIAIVVIGILTLLGGRVSQVFSQIEQRPRRLAPLHRFGSLRAPRFSGGAR